MPRGCLEIRPSSNPFFQTTANDIGVKPHEKVEWKVETEHTQVLRKPHEVDGNFAFLYTRESDVIGSKIKKAEHEPPKVLTKTEFLRKKREMQMTKALESGQLIEEAKVAAAPKASADQILAAYKHSPKNEDPRYTTSTNEYGNKPPSKATIVIDRAAIPQGFSSSFNGIKPSSSSMNTALSRSTVHPSLDPQFL